MDARPWYRRALRWARIEDEHHRLSLTTIAFAAGVSCMLLGKQVSLAELSAFAIALGAYNYKRHLRHQHERTAMETAHAAGMAQMSAEAQLALQKQSDASVALGGKIDALEQKVRELATPERIEAVQRVLGRNR